MSAQVLASDAKTVTVRVPMTFQKHGGRKRIIMAGDEPPWAPRRNIDSALVRALARAFRWRKLIETGAHATLTELAAAENVNPSYLSRILRLTLLSPTIVKAILDGRQPEHLTLARLMEPFPVEWERQSVALRLP